MADKGALYIGTSGFSYSHWQGVFYPEGLSKKEWLEYYARQFDTVEINSSFYHLPRPSTCAGWKKRVPDHFLYAMKASRFITHLKMLRNIEGPLQTLFEVIKPLGEKLGPVLFQLPPGMKKDIPLLGDFFQKLPEGLRYTCEFRNTAWYGDDLFSLLDSAGVAFCIHDLPGHVSPCVVTGTFVYVRFHGALQAYSSSYSDTELESWANRLGGYARDGYDVFAYFNNDMGGHAVRNAQTLKRFLVISGGE